MVVKRSITSQDVLERLYMLFLVRGVPEHIRQTTARSSPPGQCEDGYQILG